MKIVFHEKYLEDYPTVSVECPDRVRCIHEELREGFDFIEPRPAGEDDLRLVHSEELIRRVRRQSKLTYEVARLSAGGAIRAAEVAVEGEPSFALIRPPGHHAGTNSNWGFCFFNNMAISIERLRREGRVEAALIVDIDLHYGDGTAEIFGGVPEVSFIDVGGGDRESYLGALSEALSVHRGYDVVALSAGFDRHVGDWGGLLRTEDYRTIGEMIKGCSEKECDGRRYALLEGGYNISVLGGNARALLDGLR